jgi:hypothetical protein
MFALSFDRIAVEALIAGRPGPSATIGLSPQDDTREARQARDFGAFGASRGAPGSFGDGKAVASG